MLVKTIVAVAALGAAAAYLLRRRRRLALKSSLNIHVRLDGVANEHALRAGAALSGNAVHLGSEHVAHITLVLADFAGDAELAAARVGQLLRPIAESKPPVVISLRGGPPVPVGEYVFWDAERTPELDALLEAALRAIAPALAPAPVLPPWVAAVCAPADQQKRKEYLERYGTVNAFEFFRPHVTIGFVPGGLGSKPAGPALASMKFTATQVHINAVGEYGTVLAGGDLGVVTLSA
eukprot:7378492-Prymnesium_polylepis.1